MSLTEIAAVTNSNVVLVVWMDDELVHTAENGYTCDDETCPCHEDSEPVCVDPNCSCHEVERTYTYEDHLAEDRAYRMAQIERAMAERTH